MNTPPHAIAQGHVRHFAPAPFAGIVAIIALVTAAAAAGQDRTEDRPPNLILADDK